MSVSCSQFSVYAGVQCWGSDPDHVLSLRSSPLSCLCGLRINVMNSALVSVCEPSCLMSALKVPLRLLSHSPPAPSQRRFLSSKVVACLCDPGLCSPWD